MNETKYVTNSFRGATEHNERHRELVSDAIAEAGTVVADSLLGDHKVLCAGDGHCAMLSDYLSQMLMARFEQPRPGLPAISLTNTGNTLLSLAEDDGYADAVSTQLRALAREGDVLVVFFQAGLTSQLKRACAMARKSQIKTVAIGQDDNGDDDISQLVDIWVELDALSRARCVELQVLCLHALCELVEQRIFGFSD